MAEAAKTSIAIVGKFFPPVRGGLEEYVKGLADAVGTSLDLTVIVHAKGRSSNRTVCGGYSLVECGTLFSVSSQPVSPSMFTALRARRYDIVHLHVPNVQGILAVLMCARGARIVVTHHADMVGFGVAGLVAGWLYRQVLARTSAVTVLSLRNVQFARDLGELRAPVVALPVGLEPERFAATADVRDRADTLRRSIHGADMVISFVGRLVPYKGLNVLLRALARTTGVSCLIAGDGRERGALEQLAAELGITERVSFMGDVSDDERLAVLHCSDVFVLPSVTSAEAFGIVQVEAQFCALPVITTNLPTGVSEVTVHDVTGLIVPVRDEAALAGAILRLKADPALRQRLGVNGAARAREHYSSDALRRRALEMYEAVMVGTVVHPTRAQSS
jgi:glycosyltransferase involved in cell wall biosynthesis